MHLPMDHEKYLKQNKVVRELAHDLNIEYARQYSYSGPNCSRTKLWDIHAGKIRQNKLLRALNKLPFVDHAIYRPADRYSPDDIYVRYK